MKIKHLVCSVGLATFLTISLQAQEGGYKGPSAVSLVTVTQAQSLKDDTKVMLNGKIQKFLGGDKYLFADNTGTVTIEIDDTVWGSLSVNENDEVQISGEIDKELSGIEIDVKSIKKM